MQYTSCKETIDVHFTGLKQSICINWYVIREDGYFASINQSINQPINQSIIQARN